MAPIPPAGRDLFLAGPETYAPRFDRLRPRDDRLLFPGGAVYVNDRFVPSKPWRAARYAAHRRSQVQPNGYLQFQVQPGTAEVYVDGFYMGTVDDFRRVIPGRSLDPGPHRVELRAAGYETVTFDVRIMPNETITYRRNLDEVRPASERPVVAAPPVPRTLYVIPGCYAGDTPPRAVRLSPSCDVSKVRTIPPAVSMR